MGLTIRTDYKYIPETGTNCEYRIKEFFIEIDHTRYLSFLIQQAGIPLDMQCSGLGICKRCEVELLEGSFKVNNKIINVNIEKGEKVKALSCRTKVLSPNACVFVPERAVLKSQGKIYDDFKIERINFQPLTRKILINISEPSSWENRTEWQQLCSEVGKQCPDIHTENLSCSISTLQKLPLLLKEKREISVTLGKYHNHWHLIEIENGDTRKYNYGVAVDIGTTTVVLILIDLNNGKILGKASAYNQQMSRADDVASRISVASSGPKQLKYMKDLVVNDTINSLIRGVCESVGISENHIYRLAVSGNTVMSHLFLGLSPESIGVIPFQPVANIYPDVFARDIGIKIHPYAIINIIPSVSGYIGGDITSDLYTTGIAKHKGVKALIDLGTNSEMVLCDNGKLSAAAAAAGPAFEGAGIRCGCRAVTGAIEHIEFDRNMNFHMTVINNAKPIGICGSAIIDFIACGFKCGLINSMGRFNTEMLQQTGKYMSFSGENGKNIHACILIHPEHSATGRPIFVTERDIEQILKAKAAVYAGLKTLLSEHEYSFADLEQIILAGGFARYINIKNTVTIGMLPDIPISKVVSIGNGSLAGAYLSLTDMEAYKEFYKIIKTPDVISLNTIPEFEINFVDALMLPNYNISEFPSIS